jgi:A/G-specific adenine glycosylase
VVEQYNGELPSEATALRSLPGVGPYTVGAVRSIAFGQVAALVDGNVSRVLCRWHALTDAPSSSGSRKRLWRWAAEQVQSQPAADDPGAWNQAVMELGAVVCRPRQPDCPLCPVSAWCDAHRMGRQNEIPTPRKRTPAKVVQATYAVVLRTVGRRREVLLGKRAPTGRWAGLWEPPGIEGARADERMRCWLDEAGFEVEAVAEPLVHVLTHRRYQVDIVMVACGGAAAPDLAALGYKEQRWLAFEALRDGPVGLSAMAQRVVAGLPG